MRTIHSLALVALCLSTWHVTAQVSGTTPSSPFSGVPPWLRTLDGDRRGTNSIDFQFQRTWSTQVAAGNFSAILSGKNNQIQTNEPLGVIAGGDGNFIGETIPGTGFNVIGNGVNNRITVSEYSFLGSGHDNAVKGATGGFIGGGFFNTNVGGYQFIGGGQRNSIIGSAASAIAGGHSNIIAANFAFIGAGDGNYIGPADFGLYSAVPGGQGNNVSGNWSAALGSGLTVATDSNIVTGFSRSKVTISPLTGTTIDGAAGGLRIGPSGSMLTNLLSATATLDFPSTTAQSETNLTVTLAGAAAGDVVAIGVPTASLTVGTSYTGWASNGVVYVRHLNASSTAKLSRHALRGG